MVRGMEMKFDLPETLVCKLNAYLEANPHDNVAAMLEDALAMRPQPHRPDALLDFAGIVPDESSQTTHSIKEWQP